MGQLVSTEITIATEHFPTLVAFIWFVVCMSEEMGLEVRSLVETSPADGALVRRFFHVEDLVHGQGAGLAEALPTFQAFERFLFRVDVAVITEMILPPESLATEIAGIGPLICVSSFVDEKIV